MKASENEKVAEVLAEFGKNIELMRKCRCVEVSLWNCLKFKLRIEAAYRREVAELDRKAREANLKYRAEKARHTDTYKDASIKAQDDEIAKLKREVYDLRRRLKVAEDTLQNLQERLVASVHDGTIDPHEALKIAEDAISAIREEGATK